MAKFQAGTCKFSAGDRVKRLEGRSEYIVMGYICWPTHWPAGEPKPLNYLCVHADSGYETEMFEAEMMYA